MLREFYDLFGHNTELFITLNHFTNTSILPYFLQLISHIFEIYNFAICYVLFCLYQYFKIRKSTTPKADFDNIFYKLIEAGTIYAFLGLTYAFLKFTVNMPRPFCSLNPDQFISIANFEKQTTSLPRRGKMFIPPQYLKTSRQFRRRT